MKPLRTVHPVDIVGHVDISCLALPIGTRNIPGPSQIIDVVKVDFAVAVANGSDNDQARIESRR